MKLPHRPALRATAASIAAAVSVGCGAPMAWNHLGGEVVAEQGVYEAVVRYVHLYYDAPEWNPSPAGWCLAVGRRAGIAAAGRDGSDDSLWAPSLRLLNQLSDLSPPVLPVQDCATLDGEERVRETGERAIVIALSHPFWESPEFARVLVNTRQDPRAFNRFDCRVSRTMEGWSVNECV